MKRRVAISVAPPHPVPMGFSGTLSVPMPLPPISSDAVCRESGNKKSLPPASVPSSSHPSFNSHGVAIHPLKMSLSADRPQAPPVTISYSSRPASLSRSHDRLHSAPRKGATGSRTHLSLRFSSSSSSSSSHFKSPFRRTSPSSGKPSVSSSDASARSLVNLPVIRPLDHDANLSPTQRWELIWSCSSPRRVEDLFQSNRQVAGQIEEWCKRSALLPHRIHWLMLSGPLGCGKHTVLSLSLDKYATQCGVDGSSSLEILDVRSHDIAPGTHLADYLRGHMFTVSLSRFFGDKSRRRSSTRSPPQRVFIVHHYDEFQSFFHAEHQQTPNHDLMRSAEQREKSTLVQLAESLRALTTNSTRVSNDGSAMPWIIITTTRPFRLQWLVDECRCSQIRMSSPSYWELRTLAEKLVTTYNHRQPTPSSSSSTSGGSLSLSNRAVDGWANESQGDLNQLLRLLQMSSMACQRQASSFCSLRDPAPTPFDLAKLWIKRRIFRGCKIASPSQQLVRLSVAQAWQVLDSLDHTLLTQLIELVWENMSTQFVLHHRQRNFDALTEWTELWSWADAHEFRPSCREVVLPFAAHLSTFCATDHLALAYTRPLSKIPNLRASKSSSPLPSHHHPKSSATEDGNNALTTTEITDDSPYAALAQLKNFY